jgi:mercuric ion transport protein
MSQAATNQVSDVACSLSEERQAERRKELRSGIMSRVRRVRELPDGYAFGLGLDPADEAEAQDFVAFESQCCGFANYEVRRDEAQSTLWLSVRGPGGTKTFVKQLAPESMAIEPCEDEAAATGQKSLLRAGLAGAGAALFALICCATPILGLTLGALGLGAAAAAAGFWLDAIAAPVLLASLAVIGTALWRRRRQRAMAVAGRVAG